MATAKQLNYFRPSGTFGSKTAQDGSEVLLYTCNAQAMCHAIFNSGAIKITDNAYNVIAEYGPNEGGHPFGGCHFHVPHGGDRIIAKNMSGDLFLSVIEFQFPVSGEF